MPRVFFKTENKAVIVPRGSSILDAAKEADVVIESPCNAIGTCGKCKVLVENMTGGEVRILPVAHHLPEDEIQAGYVLACQTKVLSDITVVTVSTEMQNRSLKILDDGESFSYEVKSPVTKIFDGETTAIYMGGKMIGTEAGDTALHAYGIVVDIGTTTLVTSMYDLKTGGELSSVSSLNPQSIHAQDVLSRIHIASKADGLRTLYSEILGEINRMIREAAQTADIETKFVYEVVYSGNTAMIHLACNVSPETLGHYPYTPVLTGGSAIPAQPLDISPYGRIYLPPIISSYVGPDITSGILAAQLYKKSGTILFIDIGTNGEMVIARDGVLSATSTAAGPAFEGMNITCGMRAGAGAIEEFRINADGGVEIKVIGDIPPTGICGSGLLDIVAELVRTGVVDARGRFIPMDKAGYEGRLKEKMESLNGKPVFRIWGDVYITQQDIRQVQLAKGAIRAGVQALLASQNVCAGEVDAVLIAGSFGYHLRAQSLIGIGLLPGEFEGKIQFIGNTSKSGGKAFLLNSGFRSEMTGLVKRIANVELAMQDDFQKLFVGCLGF